MRKVVAFSTIQNKVKKKSSDGRFSQRNMHNKNNYDSTTKYRIVALCDDGTLWIKPLYTGFPVQQGNGVQPMENNGWERIYTPSESDMVEVEQGLMRYVGNDR